MKQVGGNPYRGLNAWMAEEDRKEDETVEREQIEEMKSKISQLEIVNAQISRVFLVVVAHLLKRLGDDNTEMYKEIEKAKMVWAR